MTANTAQVAAHPQPPSMHRLIVAATIGNVLEWFDFVDTDRRSAAPPPIGGAAGARHIDHLEQLILHPGLHSDLRPEDSAPAGVDRVHGDPGRGLDPGDRLPLPVVWRRWSRLGSSRRPAIRCRRAIT
jgi:hypothetical protein